MRVMVAMDDVLKKILIMDMFRVKIVENNTLPRCDIDIHQCSYQSLMFASMSRVLAQFTRFPSSPDYSAWQTRAKLSPAWTAVCRCRRQ